MQSRFLKRGGSTTASSSWRVSPRDKLGPVLLVGRFFREETHQNLYFLFYDYSRAFDLISRLCPYGFYRKPEEQQEADRECCLKISQFSRHQNPTLVLTYLTSLTTVSLLGRRWKHMWKKNNVKCCQDGRHPGTLGAACSCRRPWGSLPRPPARRPSPSSGSFLKSYRADIAANNSHQHLAKEKTEHLCGAQLLQEGKFSQTNIAVRIVLTSSISSHVLEGLLQLRSISSTGSGGIRKITNLKTTLVWEITSEASSWFCGAN